MRKHVFVLLMVLFAVVGVVRADLIWDSGHREYSAGNEKWVYMYNDASVDITGGRIDELYMYDDTSAEVTAGKVGILWGQGNSNIEVHEGSEIGLLRPNDNATASVHGGEIQVIFALGSSQTNVYGGTIDEIQARSTVNLFVDSYEINPNGGSFNHGFVTGIWLEDGSSFGINLVGVATINHLNFVPEPTSLILLIAGGLSVLRTRKKFQ